MKQITSKAIVACLLLAMTSTVFAASATPEKAKVKAKYKPVATASAKAAPAKSVSAKKSVSSKSTTAKSTTAKSGSSKVASSKPSGPLKLASTSAIVVDAITGTPLITKNSTAVESIASITKLMTAMVVLDSKLPLNEIITIDDEDVDMLKHTSSRLPVGTTMPRYDMLRLALMSSENRAASALSRHYPGGKPAFIQAMQKKAEALGMSDTRFKDSTGLHSANVSTAKDLVKMVSEASHYPLITEFTTTAMREVQLPRHSAPLDFKNTNALVRGGKWDITVSKTGYTQEAGRCLVMMTQVANRPVVMVLLESQGKLSAVGDATRIKTWLESNHALANVEDSSSTHLAMR